MSVKGIDRPTTELVRALFVENSRSLPKITQREAKVFLDTLLSQGMAPLLWHQIGGRKGSAGWPPEIQAGLHNAAILETAAELRLQVEISRLLAAFARAEIRPLLLKGTPLSYTIYPAPGLRSRCDTDMLIPESARKKTAEIMQQLGYDALHEASVDFINSQMCYFGHDNSRAYSNFDIHWLISNNNLNFSKKFNYELLASRCINIPALDTNAWTLCPEDALILACFHRAGHFSHSGDRLIWLYDIHLLAESLSAKETELFCTQARELEIVQLCVNAVDTAQFWFGTKISVQLKSLMAENSGAESAKTFLQPDKLLGIKNKALQDMQELSTTKERFRYLTQNLFPPASYMMWRYNTQHKAMLPWLYLKRFMQGMLIFLKR